MVRKRRVHSVSTLAQRRRVTLWMINEVLESGSDHRIASKAVENFQSVFNQTSSPANRSKARNWWIHRVQFLMDLNHENNGRVVVTNRLSHGIAVRRLSIKARTGRGRQQQPWAIMLQGSLLIAFHRLKKLGVNMSKSILKQTALQLVLDPDIEVTQAEIEHSTGKPLIDAISNYFITDFCNRNRLVSRRRTGNLTLSPEATTELHRGLTYHLGCLKRDYDDGVLDERDVENFDETHMVLDMGGEYTLSSVNTKRVNYAALSNGRQSFTICLRISGGPQAKIEPPLVLFPNKDSNYPIQGVPDDIDGVTYRTNPKAYMNQALFAEYFANPELIEPLPFPRVRKIWIDNPRVHAETPALLQSLEPLRTELKRFLSNATTLVQALDQYLIRIFKAEWRKRWELKQAELCITEVYTAQGRISNPGKHFYLQLVKDVIDDLNERTTDRGISLARESLICTGLAPDIDGVWKISQLTKELQSMVNAHMDCFNGLNPFE